MSLNAGNEKPTKAQFWTEMGVEMAAALTSAAFVSPFVYVIDKSLMASTSGKTTFAREFGKGMKMVCTKPWQMVTQKTHRLPFAWMFALYGATYVVDNGVSRVLKYTDLGTAPKNSVAGNIVPVTSTKQEKKGELNETGAMIKFSGTAFANVLMCTLKDRAYTKLFAGGAQRAIPKASYSLFMVRDSLTVASSFNLPEMCGHQMSNKFTSLTEKQWNAFFQFMCPVTMQFISAPLHILAVDAHLNPAKSMSERLGTIGRQYSTTSLARAARILPAFGLGGVTNTYLREWGFNKLEQFQNQEFAPQLVLPQLHYQPHYAHSK
jgi:hypothetical protein